MKNITLIIFALLFCNAAISQSPVATKPLTKLEQQKQDSLAKSDGFDNFYNNLFKPVPDSIMAQFNSQVIAENKTESVKINRTKIESIYMVGDPLLNPEYNGVDDDYELIKNGILNISYDKKEYLLTQISEEKFNTIKNNSGSHKMISCINSFLEKEQTITYDMLKMYVVATYKNVFETEFCIVEVPLSENKNKIDNCIFYKDFYFVVYKKSIKFTKQ